jgi:hypothetical protein
MPSKNAISRGTLLLVSLVVIPNLLLLSQTTDSGSPGLAANAAAYGGCAAPNQAGVHVCFPVAVPQFIVASPFQVIAAGTGAGGPVKLMEVFIDGKKVAQSSGNLFDAPVTAASGSHRLVVVELDSTGSYLKSSPMNFTIEASTAGEACPPPGSPGVNVCIPQPNSCHTAPWTTVVAAGTGASGTVSRMELWVNGTKLANFPGNHINTNIFYLQDFDRMTIVEVDSKGGYIKSTPIILQSC